MTAAAQTANDRVQPRSRPTGRNKLALIDAAWTCHHLGDLAQLTHADKAVLCGLIRHIDQAALDAGRSTVFPSTVCLSLDTGYTPRQVTRSLARLEARQLIRRFVLPRWRTPHTDLAGFMAIAADILEAHAEEKERQLRAVRRGPIAVLVEDDTESTWEDSESAPTETDIEPAISVEHANDASRGQLRRRPDKPAASNGTAPLTPTVGTNGHVQDCSPSRAGFTAGAESEPSTPAEMARAALVAAWEASPTFRRLVDRAQLDSAPVEELAAAVERDYLTTVTGIRNPHHIWAWALNRHGLLRTVQGWLVACDTPPSAARPDRNPGGWFTRFATSERPWNLSRNLQQLAKSANARSFAPPASASEPVEPASPAGPTLEPVDTSQLYQAYRAAWLRIGATRDGRQKAEAAWQAWLGEAVVAGVEDDRLQIRVKLKVAGQHLVDKYGDLCRLAAEAIGLEGVDFTTRAGR